MVSIAYQRKDSDCRLMIYLKIRLFEVELRKHRRKEYRVKPIEREPIVFALTKQKTTLLQKF